MIEPPLHQEAEGIRPRAIWGVGVGVVVVSAILIAIAWWLVAPAPVLEPAAHASTLEHGLIERATWVDRKAGIIRIPIERAIDAVVADPKLITARPPAVSANPRSTSAQTV